MRSSNLARVVRAVRKARPHRISTPREIRADRALVLPPCPAVAVAEEEQAVPRVGITLAITLPPEGAALVAKVQEARMAVKRAPTVSLDI
ncbi:MAG TPA: hypothetical protein VFL96_16870 [Acidobacteriaceae bacterium]|nr:hypothetical protein [Acidobacteriaceae bacterium]